MTIPRLHRLLLLIALTALTARGQTFEEVTRSLPANVTVLTTWGMRPEWDERGENVYFLHRLIGDVFKINVKTRAISVVTGGVEHGGIQRVQCLSNGDLLLGIGDIRTGDIRRDKEHLGLFVFRPSQPSKLFPLGVTCIEGPAVSKHSLRIAWTLPGQIEMQIGEIVYANGVPRLEQIRTLLSYRDRTEVVRLETQDFRPPDDKELLFTSYHGTNGDAFPHAQVLGIDLLSGAIRDYTHAPDSYNEAEGVFPDGQWTMIESDRHLPAELRHRYKVDIFRLRLDGSGEVEQLARLAQQYPATLRSDNPVVDRTGRYVVYQFGFSGGAGAKGQGLLMLDLQAKGETRDRYKTLDPHHPHE